MTKIKGDIYEVTCEGQYYGFANGQKSIKSYFIKWKADDHAKKQGFLSAFRNALTPKDGEDTAILKMMKEKYPDYKRFRTHVVTEAVNLSKKGQPVRELQLMNRNQIVRFIDGKGYPIDTELYPSVTDLRQALREFRENPTVFEQNQEKRRLVKGPTLAVQRSLDYLNSPEFELSAKSDHVKKAPVVYHDEDHPTPQAKDPAQAYADDEPVQEELIEVSDAPDEDIVNVSPLDIDGIPDFDDEDELDALLNGV